MASRTYSPTLPAAAPHALCRRPTAYGTLLYIPPSFGGLDVGHHPKDWRTYRSTRAARVLLVSIWADTRWGFPGGGIKPTETPAEALSREFLEETGAAIAFTEGDFLFAASTAAAPPPPPPPGAGAAGEGGSAPPQPAAPAQHPLSALSFFFCKATSDLAAFEAAVSAFASARGRTNEVYATCGMPLCYEASAPSGAAAAEAPNGLPKDLALSFVSSHGGVVRENLLLALLCKGLLSEAELARLLELSSRHAQGPHLAAPALLAMPGVAEVLAARRQQ